jgi:tRNA threonylcarbamoyladenosine modification (KEOPS) complex  Pcc1 subunit
MKTRAIIRLDISSQKQLKVVLDALKPETQNSSSRRSRVQIKGEGNSLILDFRAIDTSALRAAINSYLRQTSMVINVLRSIKEPTHT